MTVIRETKQIPNFIVMLKELSGESTVIQNKLLYVFRIKVLTFSKTMCIKNLLSLSQSMKYYKFLKSV